MCNKSLYVRKACQRRSSGIYQVVQDLSILLAIKICAWISHVIKSRVLRMESMGPML